MYKYQQSVRPVLIVLLLQGRQRKLLQLILDLFVVRVETLGIALQFCVHCVKVLLFEAVPQIQVKWIHKLGSVFLWIGYKGLHEDVLEVLRLTLTTQLRVTMRPTPSPGLNLIRQDILTLTHFTIIWIPFKR